MRLFEGRNLKFVEMRDFAISFLICAFSAVSGCAV